MLGSTNHHRNRSQTHAKNQMVPSDFFTFLSQPNSSLPPSSDSSPPHSEQSSVFGSHSSGANPNANSPVVVPINEIYAELLRIETNITNKLIHLENRIVRLEAQVSKNGLSVPPRKHTLSHQLSVTIRQTLIQKGKGILMDFLKFIYMRRIRKWLLFMSMYVLLRTKQWRRKSAKIIHILVAAVSRFLD